MKCTQKHYSNLLGFTVWPALWDSLRVLAGRHWVSTLLSKNKPFLAAFDRFPHYVFSFYSISQMRNEKWALLNAPSICSRAVSISPVAVRNRLLHTEALCSSSVDYRLDSVPLGIGLATLFQYSASGCGANVSTRYRRTSTTVVSKRSPSGLCLCPFDVDQQHRPVGLTVVSDEVGATPVALAILAETVCLFLWPEPISQ